MNEERPSPAATIDGRPIRLLYVDDEPVIVSLAERELTAFGYDFTGATNSREALDLFQSDVDRFDLVVSDIAMPQPTGNQLARLIHRLRPDLPVILISGDEQDLDSAEAQRLNIVAYLTKPFEMEDLDARIRGMFA